MHARLKNEFTEDEKCHNLMRWLKYFQRRIQDPLFDYEEETEQQREQTPEPANEELSVETVCSKLTQA